MKLIWPNGETREKKEKESITRVQTRKLPWLALIEVNFSDGPTSEVAVENLLDEIVSNELLVGWVEPEPRRQVGVTVVKMVVCLHDKNPEERKISSNSDAVDNDHGEVGGRRRVERMGCGVGGEECYKGFAFRRD